MNVHGVGILDILEDVKCRYLIINNNTKSLKSATAKHDPSYTKYLAMAVLEKLSVFSGRIIFPSQHKSKFGRIGMGAKLQTWDTGIQCPFCEAIFFDSESYKFHIDGHLADNPLRQLK